MFRKGGRSLIKKYLLSENKNLKLSKNFKLAEFACADKSDEVFVSEELVKILQNVRDHFGKAVVITSAYRTLSHNKKAGGASGSRHLTGEAADFTIKGISPAKIGYYLEGLSASGIGVYVSRGFVHVDVRENGKWRGLIFDGKDGKEENLAKYFPTVRVGSKGNSVKLLQMLLKIDADGIFGKKTKEAVEKHQKGNDLGVDGIVGPLTWKSLLDT